MFGTLKAWPPMQVRFLQFLDLDAWNFWILCINLASTYISISIFTIMQVVSNAYFGEAFCTKTVSRCQHLNRDSNHQLAAYKLVALTAGLCLSQVVHCEFLAACTNIAG